jgi:hypothetical protein
VFVLAVSESVGQDLGREMRLVSADAERNSDVTEFRGDEVVENLDFFGVGFGAGGERVSFGFNVRSDLGSRLR